MNKNKVKPIIGRVGGKWRLSNFVIEHIERFDWSLYVEPFCGSAAIYFQLLNKGIPEKIKARGHHPRFVLNDLDSRIINLYRCCRDFPELLAYSIYFTPYSREEHRNAQKGEAVDDLIELCNRFLVDGWQSMKKEIGGSFGIAKEAIASRPPSKCPARDLNSVSDRILSASLHLGRQFLELKTAIESINDETIRNNAQSSLNAILDEFQRTIETDIRVEFVRRFLVDNWQSIQRNSSWGLAKDPRLDISPESMPVSPEYFKNLHNSRILKASPVLQEIQELKRVYLENDDFEKVCRRWDTHHSLHYLDAPYYGKEDYYAEKFCKDDHLRLCQMAHELEGQVIISYYPHEEIMAMYSENDWEMTFKETVASSAGVTKNSKTRTRPKRTELLLVRKNKNPEKKMINLSGQLSLF